ncbi:MAG: NADP oxidoreductase [Dictyoglomus sp. NZ13-RE01]|nr:MAG: NADP oxidoreductase [Dictyoglomus sp. NZ13-RE01]
MAKLKVASIWCEGCSGCHMSFLDMDERLVELINKGLELNATPITDLKVPDEDTDIGIIEGAIATDHHEEEVKMMREKCKFIVAIGDCAVFGGIPTMRNYFTREELLERGYITTESTVQGKIPTSEEIGKHLPKTKAVNEVIKVDFYIPGCPPSADAIYYVLKEILEGRTPVLSGDLLKYE